MAGQIDFKQFYEQSKITSDSISLLRAKSTMFHRQDKSFKDATSNMAFGMLAHLNIINEGDTPFIFSRLPILGISDFSKQTTFFESLERLGIIYGTQVNPTALPLIRKYRAAFDKYEAQLGIKNPFTKKEGKEPGDN